MGFHAEYKRYKGFDFSAYFAGLTTREIEQTLNKDRLDVWDYLALLSEKAEPYLEVMAQKAHRLTVQHFGRTMQLYTPIYLANYCVNACVYCGFRANNQLPRKRLSLPELEEEAALIAESGLKHIIILTGESRKMSSVSYLLDCVQVLKKYFASINIEVYPLEETEYVALIKAGVDALTVYQETYNEALYRELHPAGPKRDYLYRLETPERACRAGIRSVNLGALLGLDAWRAETFFTGLHAYYLQQHYPEVEIAISLPRIRPQLGGFVPRCAVSDKNLVQYLLAFRLFMPRAGITISTRERPAFRDNLIRLGITKMSAGSCTAVGGRTGQVEEIGQFDISDTRGVEAIKKMLYQQGYQPVFKDWHQL